MISSYAVTALPGSGPLSAYIWLMALIPDQIAVATLPSGNTAEAAGARAVGTRQAFPRISGPVVRGPTLYFASEDWTSPASDPVAANRWYDGRLDNAGNLSWAVPLLPSSASPPDGDSLGRVVLVNTDGRLDDLPDRLGLQNARVSLSVIPRGGNLSQAVPIWTAVVRGIDVSLDTVEIGLLPLASMLDQNVPAQVYAGSGGMEGPTDLEGVQKPQVFGRVFNMSPVLIEPLTYIYQAHAGVLAQVTAVRFGGVPMVFAADYPSYAALLAATVVTGEYATCLAQGLIKAGLTQGGANDGFTLTADVATAEDRAVRLAKAAAQAAAGLYALTVNTASFDAVDAAVGSSGYGLLVTDPLTWRGLLDDMLGSVGASWGSGRDGSIGAILPVIPTAAVADLQEYDILDLDRLALPDGYRWPFAAQTVRYGRNWSVQTALAAIVRNPSLSRDWKDVTVQAAPAAAGANLPETLETGLRTKDGAQALAGRALALHGVARRMFAVTLPLQEGLFSAWTAVRITYPRFGMTGGNLLAVVAADEDYAAGTMTLTLWG